ncbi:MAG: (2Fe-2S)-binding protein [Bacteriovoracaceae bacterium]|jgi:ferredoxin|nr:(2Fe-2S)-binding protein [Bacteriovoracaceae bacterium]
MDKYKVTLLPSQQTVYVSEGQPLLDVLKEAGVYIKSNCGGVASCSDCIVKICSGGESISPAEFDELKLLGNVYHITKERLSCQLKVHGDVTVDVSAHNQKRDESHTQKKSAKFKPSAVKLKKKDIVQAEQSEREQKRKEEAEEWKKPWEKEKNPLDPKSKKGGNKRPVQFKYSSEDEE